VAGLRWGIGVCVWALMAGSALAQQGGAQTATTAPIAADPAPPTTVVVQGQRNDVSDRIDRRVYNIKDDPDSQSGTAGDVLGKLPSVTVSPSGSVSLRGDSSVTVLVDGKYPVNSHFLETLAAADIDRIEVITNPSAQYDAEGTGGIINIITKKRHPFGLSGTTTARVTTRGQANANASLSLTQGPWSLTGRLNAGYYPGLFTSSTVETYPDAVSSISREHFDSLFGGGELQVARKFGDHQTVTLDATSSTGWSRTLEQDSYQSDSQAFTTRANGVSRNLWDEGEFTYDYNNETSGRHFTLDASLGEASSANRTPTTQTYTVPTSGQAVYDDQSRSGRPVDDIKADYEMRPASGNLLNTGLEWKRDGTDGHDLYSDTGTIAGPYIDGGTHAFFGQRDVTAAYVTWQHPLFAGWIMMPGLRAEYEALDIRSQGLEVRPDTLRFYPTLHLSHALGKGKIKLSYSRRVDRPWLGEYDPARIYQSSVSAEQGNPNLKPPTTDSYELGYEFSQGKTSYDATLYYRALQNALSQYAQDIGNGVTLTTPVNFGHSRSAGSEFTVKRPVSKHWNLSFNLNLFYNSVPLLSGSEDVPRGALTYSSNSTLEYDADKGDQWQAAFEITGRELNSQGYMTAYSHLDFTWKHNLTKKLALVVNAQDVLAGEGQVQVYNTAALRSKSFWPDRYRLLRVSLTRTFGGPAGK